MVRATVTGETVVLQQLYTVDLADRDHLISLMKLLFYITRGRQVSMHEAFYPGL